MTSDNTQPQPSVVQALAAVMRDIGAIGKDQKNTHQGYNFRGIDDVYNALHSPLVKHGVILLPEVEDRIAETRETTNSQGKTSRMNVVHLLMRYRFYGPAGDSLDVRVWGEGQDSADKATNKAMSAAMKYALLQTFAIPTDDLDEGDRETVEASPSRQSSGQSRQTQSSRQSRQSSGGGQQRQQRQQAEQPDEAGQIRSQIATVANAQGHSTDDIAADFRNVNGGIEIGQASPPELRSYLQRLQSRNGQQPPGHGGKDDLAAEAPA